MRKLVTTVNSAIESIQVPPVLPEILGTKRGQRKGGKSNLDLQPPSEVAVDEGTNELGGGGQSDIISSDSNTLLAQVADTGRATGGAEGVVVAKSSADAAAAGSILGGISTTTAAIVGGSAVVGIIVVATSGGESTPPQTPAPVNNAPTGTASAILAAGTEDTAYTVSVANLLAGFSDADGDTLSVANLSASNGVLVNNNNGTYTITPSANFNGTVTLTYNVIDGNGGSVAANQSYSLVAVNDAPTATNLNAAETYTEDTALNLTDIVASDVDGGSITATLTLSDAAAGNLSTAISGAVTSTFVGGVWSASGALANVNALLAGVTFTPTLNFNSTFTIATSVRDGVAPAITGVKAMTGTAVNDAPTATNLNAAETYTENTALNLIDVVASDVDSANITVTLTLSNVAAGSLSAAISGAVTSTFVGGVWSASGALANVNALLADVTFAPASNFNPDFPLATIPNGSH